MNWVQGDGDSNWRGKERIEMVIKKPFTFYKYFKILFIFRARRWENERERNINQLPDPVASHTPPAGD